MLPTPQYKLDEREDETVYPPSEDTFLLLDALELEAEKLKLLEPLITLEIGCGSGVVTTFLHQILSRGDGCGSGSQSSSPSTITFSVCTDLNLQALKCTRRTADLNSIAASKLDLVECDLFEPLFQRYVPTDRRPAQTTEELYYAGGSDGREVIDRALLEVAELLSPQGCFYMVALEQNKVPEIIRDCAPSLSATVVLQRRCGIEHLYVLKFCRNLDV